VNARRRISLLSALLALGPAAHAELYYVIVGGLGGNPDYEQAFTMHARKLGEAAERTLGGDARVSVLVGSQATREALRERLGALATRTKQSDRVAVFLVGHGSYDGTSYKFNLPGPDIDGAELGQLLGAIPARAQLVVNATSASGAVLEDWATGSRAVITATRSGAERNATRFAEYFAASLSADDADLNKNGMITAQEAFDYTARRVADSYESEGTLATEHPQLKGENVGSFEIARLKPIGAETPALTGLNAERAALEERIAELRLRREELGEDYLPQLETLLIELARVQERIDAAEPQ
jgi:hypothetical protein